MNPNDSFDGADAARFAWRRINFPNRINTMNKRAAEAVAKALRGRTWQSGGDIWLVLFDRADGHLVVISDDSVNEYESEADFEESQAANFITLR